MCDFSKSGCELLQNDYSRVEGTTGNMVAVQEEYKLLDYEAYQEAWEDTIAV